MFFDNSQLDAINRSNAVIHFDLKGNILEVNDNFLKAVGYTRQEIIGRHHSIFVFDSNSESYKNFWEKLAKGEFDSGTYKRRTKSGEEIWLKATYNPVFKRGKIVKFVKFAQDVTQEELEKANAQGQLEAINRVQGVIEFDAMGNILTANKNFLKITGYKISELVNQHHRIFIYPEQLQSEEYKMFWQNLASGIFNNGVFKRKAKNGKEVWLQASYNPIFAKDGSLIKIVKYATDITKEHIRSEKMALALDSLAKAIQLSEQSAKAANALVKSSHLSVLEQEKLIKDLSTNMKAMIDSANNIRSITEIMDGISFQTSLLAVNAKIEAAHAGSKGFGVVAKEVGDLSTQSSASSKKIKDLINDSVSKMSDGFKLVDKANEMSAESTQAIEKASTIMSEIEQNSMQQIKAALELFD